MVNLASMLGKRASEGANEAKRKCERLASEKSELVSQPDSADQSRRLSKRVPAIESSEEAANGPSSTRVAGLIRERLVLASRREPNLGGLPSRSYTIRGSGLRPL